MRFADNKYLYKNDFAGPLVLTLRWNFQGQPSFSAAAGVASIYREKKKAKLEERRSFVFLKKQVI